MFFLLFFLLLATPLLGSKSRKGGKKIPTFGSDDENLTKILKKMIYIHTAIPLNLLLPTKVYDAYHYFRKANITLIDEIIQNLKKIQKEVDTINNTILLKRELYQWAKSVIELLGEGHEKRLNDYHKMKEDGYYAKTRGNSLELFFKSYDDILNIVQTFAESTANAENRLKDLEADRTTMIYESMLTLVENQKECITISGKSDLLSKVKLPPSIELLGKEGIQGPLFSKWINEFFNLQLCIGRKSCFLCYSANDIIPRFISDQAMSSIKDISESKFLVNSSNEHIRGLGKTLKNMVEELNKFLVSFDEFVEDIRKCSNLNNSVLESNFKLVLLSLKDQFSTVSFSSLEDSSSETKNFISSNCKQIARGLLLFREKMLNHKIISEKSIIEEKISSIENDSRPTYYSESRNKLVVNRKALRKSREKIEESTSIKAEKYIRTIRIFQDRISSKIFAINDELKRMSQTHQLPELVSDNNFSLFFYEDEDSFNNFIEKQRSIFDKLIHLLPPGCILDSIPESINIIESTSTVEDVEEATPKEVSLKKKNKNRKKEFNVMSVMESPKYCLAPQIDQDLRPSKDTLKVASFNAQWLFLFSKFNNNTFWGNQNDAMDHFNLVVKYIEILNADILLLQEVEDCRVLLAISKKLPHMGYSPYVVENRDTSFGQHVGLLSRVPPMDLAFIESFKKGDEGEVVGVAKNLVAHFKVQNSAGAVFPIMLVGAHLISGDLTLKRTLQAEIISEYIELNRHEEESLIILGDMNDHDDRLNGEKPSSSALKILSQNGKMENVMEGIDQWKGTFYGGGSIDHILLSSDLQYSDTTVHKRDAFRRFGLVSDHAAVSCVIHLE